MSAQDNIAAGLATIRECEGTNTPDGYRALFGYHPTLNPTRLFDNGFAKHPNIKFSFMQTDGTMNYTTAAGAYQFIFPTWSRVAAKLSLPDFSPASQDLAAIELISEAHALLDLEEGDLQSFIERCSPVWASLPSSRYKQPKRTLAFAEAAFKNAGGTFA